LFTGGGGLFPNASIVKFYSEKYGKKYFSGSENATFNQRQGNEFKMILNNNLLTFGIMGATKDS